MESAISTYNDLLRWKLIGKMHPNFSVSRLLNDLITRSEFNRGLYANEKKSAMLGLVRMAGTFNWKNPLEWFAGRSKYNIHGRPLKNDESYIKLPSKMTGDAFLFNMRRMFNANTGDHLIPVTLTKPVQDKARFLRQLELTENQEFLRTYGFGYIQEHGSKTDELLVDDTNNLLAKRRSRNVTESLSAFAFAYTPGYRWIERQIERLGGVSQITDDHLLSAFTLNQYYANPIIRSEGFEAGIASAYNQLNTRRKPINYQQVTYLKHNAACLSAVESNKRANIVNPGFNTTDQLITYESSKNFCNDKCPLFKARTCGVLLHRAGVEINQEPFRSQLGRYAEDALWQYKSELVI